MPGLVRGGISSERHGDRPAHALLVAALTRMRT